MVRWSPTAVPTVGPVKTVRWANRAVVLFFERRGTAHLEFRYFQRIQRAFVTMALAWDERANGEYYGRVKI